MSLNIQDTEGLSGIAPEDFSGSLVRDTLDIADPIALELFETDISLSPFPESPVTGYELSEGWNILGWPLPFNLDIIEAFTLVLGHEPTLDDIIILKNNNGNAYLPEFFFNGVGDFQVGQGYQIKLPPGSPLIGILTFIIPDRLKDKYGFRTDIINDLQNISFIAQSGWNILGYNRLQYGEMSIPDIFRYARTLQMATTPLNESLSYDITIGSGETLIHGSGLSNFTQGDRITIFKDSPQYSFQRTIGQITDNSASIDAIPFSDITDNPYLNAQAQPGTITFNWVGESSAQLKGDGTQFTNLYNNGEFIPVHIPQTGNSAFASRLFMFQILEVISDTVINLSILNIENALGTGFLGSDGFDIITTGTVKYKPIYVLRSQISDYVDSIPLQGIGEYTMPYWSSVSFGDPDNSQAGIALVHLVGTGTSFTTDFTVGNRVLISYGSAYESDAVFKDYTISAIYSDTLMAVNEEEITIPWIDVASTSVVYDGTGTTYAVITGTGTTFTSDFSPGDPINMVTNQADAIKFGEFNFKRSVVINVVSDTELHVHFPYRYQNTDIDEDIDEHYWMQIRDTVELERIQRRVIPIDSFATQKSLPATRYFSLKNLQAYAHYNWTLQETDLTDKITIVKDNSGKVYMPEFEFNGIGNAIPGAGYQVKTTEQFEMTWPTGSLQNFNILPLIDQ